MKVPRPKTEQYHNYEEGDVAKPINNYFKKGKWKRFDRKKFFRKLFESLNKTEAGKCYGQKSKTIR